MKFLLKNNATLKTIWSDNRYFFRFLLVFFGAFCIFYFGSLFLVGAADPRGMIYWPRFSWWFNYLTALTNLITGATWQILDWMGFDATRTSFKTVRIPHAAVSIEGPCLGYGVMSFWLAFMVANKIPLLPKLVWSVSGLAVIIFINIWRVVLIILGIHYHWFNPRLVTHTTYHNTFSAVAYGFVFLLMWRFTVWEARNELRIKDEELRIKN